MAKIGIVIFDLFGVVFSKGFESSVAHLEAALNRDAEVIGPVYRKWEHDFDLGRIDDDLFWSHVNEELGTNVHKQILTEIVLSGYRVNTDVLHFVKRLRGDIRCLAYSNYRREWFDRLDSRHNISGFFEEVLISSDVGLLKPDPNVFHYISSRTSSPLDRMVLIDDQIENIRGAIETGAHGILFRNIFQTALEFDLLTDQAISYD